MYFLNGTRYYILELYRNLFNQYNVEMTFGSTLYKSYTGKKIKIFNNYEDANTFLKSIIKKRLKRGYILLT